MKLKMSVHEFGETCNRILDAFERGEPTVPTPLALNLVGHIQAVLEEDRREIQALHDQYAHEGGKPQVMTTEVLTRWLAAIEIPTCNDLFKTSAPNVFYATFALPLYGEHFAQLRALGIEAVDPRSQLRNRYMLTWQPPRNDEP